MFSRRRSARSTNCIPTNPSKVASLLVRTRRQGELLVRGHDDHLDLALGSPRVEALVRAVGDEALLEHPAAVRAPDGAAVEEHHGLTQLERGHHGHGRGLRPPGDHHDGLPGVLGPAQRRQIAQVDLLVLAEEGPVEVQQDRVVGVAHRGEDSASGAADLPLVALLTA